MFCFSQSVAVNIGTQHSEAVILGTQHSEAVILGTQHLNHFLFGRFLSMIGHEIFQVLDFLYFEQPLSLVSQQ